MSLPHSSRIFRKVMGLSYQEYLSSRRILEATYLLCTSARSVAEIVSSLGFSNPTGLGRIFKKVTGNTPAEFRSHPRK